MRFVPIMAAVLACVPVAAYAQAGPVTLRPGEAAAIRIDGDDTVLIARGGAVMTPLDRSAAQQVTQLPVPDAPVPTGAPMSAPGVPVDAIAPDRVTVRLFTLNGGKTLLVLENGLGTAIRYRATMRVNGKDQPTDVCLVPMGKRSYEYWPHAVDALTLSDFRPADYTDGPVPCE